MEKRKLFLFSIQILVILIYVLITGCSGSLQGPVPIKMKALSIPDREFLKYSKYVSGEKTDTSYFVGIMGPGGHDFTEYIEMVASGEESNIPANYTNYHYFIKMSLDTGSLIEQYSDYHDLPQGLKGKAPDFIDLKIDYENHIASYVMKIKDKEEERVSYSKVKLKPGFPVWNMTSLLFAGPRLLDIKNKGLLYVIEPFYVKEPVPGSFKIIGKEFLETPAGRFNTLKVGFSIADPFLGKLLDIYTQSLFFWIEDSPRGLIVKTQGDNNINILDEVSVWKE